jgi:hypothetical protein
MLLGQATGVGGRSMMEMFWSVQMLGLGIGGLVGTFLLVKSAMDDYQTALLKAQNETTALEDKTEHMKAALGRGEYYHEGAGSTDELMRMVDESRKAGREAGIAFDKEFDPQKFSGKLTKAGKAFGTWLGGLFTGAAFDTNMAEQEELSRKSKDAYQAGGNRNNLQYELTATYENQLNLKRLLLAIDIQQHNLLMSHTKAEEAQPDIVQSQITAGEHRLEYLKAARADEYKRTHDNLMKSEGYLPQNEPAMARNEFGRAKLAQFRDQAENTKEVLDYDKQIRDQEEKQRTTKEQLVALTAQQTKDALAMINLADRRLASDYASTLDGKEEGERQKKKWAEEERHAKFLQENQKLLLSNPKLWKQLDDQETAFHEHEEKLLDPKSKEHGQNWAGGELQSLMTPAQQMVEYAKKVRDAFQAHAISGDKAGLLMSAERKKLGIDKPGGMSSVEDLGRSIQEAILADDTPKQQLQAQKDALKELQEINASLLVLVPQIKPPVGE